jgi:hypothetical protein
MRKNLPSAGFFVWKTVCRDAGLFCGVSTRGFIEINVGLMPFFVGFSN